VNRVPAWRIAAAVVAGLVVTALIAHSNPNAIWWLMPLVVVVALGDSLWRATRT
jgi:membrane glycosyltransferase